MNTETKTKWTAGQTVSEFIYRMLKDHPDHKPDGDSQITSERELSVCAALGQLRQSETLAPEMAEALRALVECPDYRGIKTHEMEAARALLAKLPK